MPSLRLAVGHLPFSILRIAVPATQSRGFRTWDSDNMCTAGMPLRLAWHDPGRGGARSREWAHSMKKAVGSHTPQLDCSVECT
jgi:hypothetical protein